MRRSVVARPLPWFQARLPRPVRWAFGIAVSLLLMWQVLAIGYAPLPWPGARWAAAVAFAAFSFWALWWSRRGWPVLLLGALFLAWLATWASIRPSHDREWRPEVAVMPRIDIDGDRILIRDYRHFEYRSVDDFTIRYEDRELQLSKLMAMDFYVSYWREGPVAHTFVSFIFEGEDPVSVSIETRPEAGEGFEPIASLFKRFELIYLVGDERDIVKVRSNHRHEQVFLYKTNLTTDAVRRLFLVYAERVNELADRAEFYHLLSNSCTINIVRYANRIGRTGLVDVRHVLNGWSDRYLYRQGFVDTSLPFAELRARSSINAAANAAEDDPDFPTRIHEGRPTPRPYVPEE
jgi:hypothetical protein